MAPSEEAMAGRNDDENGALTAPSLCKQIVVLAVRADFLKVATGRRQSTPSFLLQARERPEPEAAMGIRVGYTCSKKLGNAVMRNRAKRRLREIARKVLPGLGKLGWDYVLVGRPDATINRPFDLMLGDLHRAMAQIHTKP